MYTRIAVWTVAGMSTLATGLSSAGNETYDDALIRGFKNGKALVDVRVRYEDVDDQNIDDRGQGLTVRTRLGYQTASMGGFRLLGEFTDTRTLFGVNEYAPEQDGYPTIVDPVNTEVNRAIISYEGWQPVWLALGRQRIILDDARWVGNVGWRQKEQTYDSGSIDWNIGQAWLLSYDYIAHVNGVNPDGGPKTDYDSSDHILNLAYTGWQAGKLVGYGYFLKNEEDQEDDERNTVGLRFAGNTKTSGLNWLYHAEYAWQEYEPQSGGTFKMNYYTLMGGIGFKPLTLKLGHEVLGSDGGDQSLQTPLATKFKFNGWADLFLTTPVDGLRDTYLSLSSNWLGLNWLAVYHDFRTDHGSDRYGSELDLHIAKGFGKHYLVGVKYADFRADDVIEGFVSKDRRKFWLWFEFKY